VLGLGFGLNPTEVTKLDEMTFWAFGYSTSIPKLEHEVAWKEPTLSGVRVAINQARSVILVFGG